MMSPEEIRVAVQEALKQGVSLPWWNYVAAFFVSLAGAYFGAYAKRKGEERATQENFDRLREQLRRTTQDAEDIKSILSRRNWLTQQQWSVREEHYLSLLSHLMKLRLSLQDRDSYFMEPGSEHNENLARGDHFQALAAAGHEAYQAIRELIGPASVFLSGKAIQALEKLVADHWSAAEFSACTADYVSTSLNLVEAAYVEVLAEARAELSRAPDD